MGYDIIWQKYHYILLGNDEVIIALNVETGAIAKHYNGYFGLTNDDILCILQNVGADDDDEIIEEYIKSSVYEEIENME